MRREPSFERIDLEFADGTFPASATIAFEANNTDDVPPARSISVEAGRLGTWVIRFRPGAELPEGARVGFRKIDNSFRFDWRHQDYWPDALGYVTVEDGEGSPLPFECDRALKSRVPAVVVLPRRFGPDGSIIVRIGDQRDGGPGVWAPAARYDSAEVRAGVRLPGEKKFRAGSDGSAFVTIVPRPPVRRYYLFAPSTARPGQDVTAVALPTDLNGNAMPPGRDLEVVSPDARVVEADGRSVRVEARLREEGVSRIELRERESGVRAASNPIRVSPEGPDLYWGEFHCHGYDAVEINVLNDNVHPAGAFAYGRDVTGLDFMAMGSHIFRHAPEAVHRWWELYREAAEKYHEEGRYVTFPGCEWRDAEDRGGDRNLVWKDLDVPAPNPTWTIEEVYGRLGGGRSMVIPHVGGAIAYPCCHDPRAERLCEMVSGHGNFEWFAQSYLQKGYRLGLIGGSDGHKGTPGHPRIVARTGGRFFNLLRRRDSGWSGGPLLAVYADRLDRESLWEAFRERRTYASTGARALVEFRVNGEPMGSEIEADSGVDIRIDLHGTAPIKEVDLIRGPHRLKRWACDSRSVETQLRDRPPDGPTYYYLRVEQRDGEMLWSSPVWVESSCGGDAEGLPAWNEPEDIDLDAVAENPAGEHLPDLLDYLRTEEKREAFTDITPLEVVDSPRGSYAVFLARVRGKRVRIHWFYGFEFPRLRLEAGWVHYGREPIKGQSWSRPLFESQDRMG